jgi:hypothetical protein
MYIGSYKIKKKTPQDDGTILLSLKGHPDFPINPKLLELVETDAPLKDANVTDAITHVIAVDIIDKLASYELDYYFVNNIAMKINVLAHNLREDLIRKTFDCSGGDAINLKKIV